MINLLSGQGRVERQFKLRDERCELEHCSKLVGVRAG